MKIGKAVGPDGVHIELIKLLGDFGIDVLVKLFNNIYDTGELPDDWLKSSFLPIPKTSNAKTCNKYRLISLMSHVLKIFLKILHNRMYNKIDYNIWTQPNLDLEMNSEPGKL